MATCHTPRCSNWAEPNPADTENGPNAHDLDPVYCNDCYDAFTQDAYDTYHALHALGFTAHYIYNMPGTGVT